ncbi:hypothetical protein D3C81_1349440 [compost metagenome]
MEYSSKAAGGGHAYEIQGLESRENETESVACVGAGTHIFAFIGHVGDLFRHVGGAGHSREESQYVPGFFDEGAGCVAIERVFHGYGWHGTAARGQRKANAGDIGSADDEFRLPAVDGRESIRSEEFGRPRSSGTGCR